MALIQNYSVNFQSSVKQIGGGMGDATGTGTNSSNNMNRFANADMLVRGAIPNGYTPGSGAWLPAKTSGGLGVNSIGGTGRLSYINIWGVKFAVATIIGSGQITNALAQLFGELVSTNKIIGTGGFQTDPNMLGILNAIATLTGGGIISDANALGFAELIADIKAKGQFNNADFQAVANLIAHIYVNQSTATVTQIVDGVWEALAASHDNPGTMGNKMNAAGAAGDPWSTLTSTQTVPGTMGKTVVDIDKKTGLIPALL